MLVDDLEYEITDKVSGHAFDDVRARTLYIGGTPNTPVWTNRRVYYNLRGLMKEV